MTDIIKITDVQQKDAEVTFTFSIADELVRGAVEVDVSGELSNEVEFVSLDTLRFYAYRTLRSRLSTVCDKLLAMSEDRGPMP